jgi:acetolactate synthase-1/2/3 large subunit
MTTVSERVAEVLAGQVDEVFALMGNGNAYFVDALARQSVRMHAMRHETATVAAADAYYRVSRRPAVATTTFGPGFTNTLTSLAEAAQANTPVLLVVGDAPSTGPRPWDVDQTAMAAAMGVNTFTVTVANAGQTALDAFHYAVTRRTAVVLAIPYDVGASPAADEGTLVPGLPPLATATAAQASLEHLAELLAQAERPLVLAGRGARSAARELAQLADLAGALTASSAPARGTFAGRPYDLGVAGGFASEPSAALIKAADVVLVVGARLNQFTTSFGHAFGEAATVVQIDVGEAATSPLVDHFIRADAADAIPALVERFRSVAGEGRTGQKPWGGSAEQAKDSTLQFDREPGDDLAPDGRLDPRSLMRRLNTILPAERQLVSDGGHFIGWANTYFELPSPDSITLVGTTYQSIGLGLPSAAGAAVARPERTTVVVTGDGGGLMGLPDLDTLVRVARSAVVLVFNDAAYGAEVHQYGSQGLDQEIMQIPQVDFAQLALGFGAKSAVIRTLDDLDQIQDWVDAGAEGTFVADLRISQGIIAPYILEIIELTLKRPEPAGRIE